MAGLGSVDELIYQVIGCCIEVHKTLGPGFLESVYHRAMEVELAHQEIKFQTQCEVELTYRGRRVGKHRIDLIIADRLVVELKAVEELARSHYAQVRSYLKAAKKDVGILVNFADSQLDPRRVDLKRDKSRAVEEDSR